MFCQVFWLYWNSHYLEVSLKEACERCSLSGLTILGFIFYKFNTLVSPILLLQICLLILLIIYYFFLLSTHKVVSELFSMPTRTILRCWYLV